MSRKLLSRDEYAAEVWLSRLPGWSFQDKSWRDQTVGSLAELLASTRLLPAPAPPTADTPRDDAAVGESARQQLLNFINRYAFHDERCLVGPCDCGYREAYRAIAALLTERSVTETAATTSEPKEGAPEPCHCGARMLDRWCGTYCDHAGTHTRDECTPDIPNAPEPAASRPNEPAPAPRVSDAACTYCGSPIDRSCVILPDGRQFHMDPCRALVLEEELKRERAARRAAEEELARFKSGELVSKIAGDRILAAVRESNNGVKAEVDKLAATARALLDAAEMRREAGR